MAVALVDRIRLLGDDDGAHAIQGGIAKAAVCHDVADDELALAFVRHALELAVASVLAITGFDAVSLYAEGSLAGGLGCCSHVTPPC